MTDSQWQAWRRYLAAQIAEEEANPEDCIPYMECECPPKGTEAS